MFSSFFGKKKPEEKPTAEDYEEKILASQGLIKDKNVFISNVQLEDKKNHIHTIEAGRGNKEKLVLIHGYGASGVFYWKMISQLSKYFHVYSIDQLGMGTSSRPDFNLKDYDETVEFFCGAIESWRKEVGIEDEYILMGHSFGGYTAAQFARTRKKEKLKKLYLLSPAGYTHRDIGDMDAELKAKFKMGVVKRSFFKSVFWLIHEKQFTPFQILKLFGKERSLKKYYGSKRMKLVDQEIDLFTKYYHEVTNLKVSSDKSLGTFLQYGRYSKNPIIDTVELLTKEKRLPKLTVIYGDKDWMDKEASIKESNMRGLNVNFKIIKDCGHQIVFEQPVEVAKLLVEDMGWKFEEQEPKNLLDEKLNICLNEEMEAEEM